jgi:hypothetical protein
MNAPLLPQILLRQDQSPQADLDLAIEGVLRYVWSGQWGDMLIEARDGVVYVNGQRVDVEPPPPRSYSNSVGGKERSDLSDTKNR